MDSEPGPDSDDEPDARSSSYEYYPFLDQNNHPHDFPYHMYPFKYPGPVPEIDDQYRADIYESLTIYTIISMTTLRKAMRVSLKMEYLIHNTLSKITPLREKASLFYIKIKITMNLDMLSSAQITQLIYITCIPFC